MMRYHWSLGIGHTYSHNNLNTLHSGDPSVDILRLYPAAENSNKDISNEAENGMDVDASNADGANGVIGDEEDPDSDDPEFAMDDRENEDLGSDDDWDDERFNQSDHDDELFRTYHMRQ